jgi:hypothetical protein
MAATEMTERMEGIQYELSPNMPQYLLIGDFFNSGRDNPRVLVGSNATAKLYVGFNLVKKDNGHIFVHLHDLSGVGFLEQIGDKE